MEYKRFDNTIFARIDKGEEILEQLKEIALQEHIKLASVSALGAINDFTVGVFKTAEKKYYANEFQGYYEITSLTGTITTKEGETYLHIHMAVGNAVKSSVLTLVRTLFLFVPLGYLFSRISLGSFFLTFPVTETLTSAVGFIFYIGFLKKGSRLISGESPALPL